MADSNFAGCLAVVLQNEGGFVDNPADPGGATSLGITLRTLSAWRGSTQTIADVEALTVEDVTPIYQADYWNVAHCGQLPVGVDLMVFDESVNAGPGRAVRALQTALGITADGLFGPATQAAVDASHAAPLIDAIAKNRVIYYEGLPTFQTFGHGWLARVARTEAAALMMIQ